ncbi:O-antigen ligase [Telluribacter sp. SYSU D00476]|uniref:O-antigen ligase family protein n=1 Tax=Telluribacter sp. SYSU D00476 TaxID=2811430 RepID=UPI001FF6B87B|nr:O-antigen ligase family protein [Telluribacter sp. SYSU D00476]
MILPIVLFFLLTIGNYSFFRYSVFGNSSAPAVLRIISQLRFLLPVWIVLYAFRFSYSFSSRIVKDNIDVLLLGLSWLLSSLVSLDSSSYMIYGTWTLSCFLAVLFFVGYAAVVSREAGTFYKRILHTIWIGNIIILLLDIGSLFIIRPGVGPYNIIFSSNTFWAYPTMILGILAVIQMKLSSERKQKLIYLFIYCVALYMVYLSARRTPLFVLLLSPFLLYIPLRLPYVLLFSFMLLATVALTSVVDLRTITDILPDSYAKYRIERMLGLVKGREETSYQDRQRIWRIYLDSFYENPIMGAGLAANERITERYSKDLEGYSAHNTFVGLVAETGLLGTLLFIVFLIRSLRKLLQLRNILFVQVYLVLFLPTLLINWVEYNLIPGQIFFLYSVVIWMIPRGLNYLHASSNDG